MRSTAQREAAAFPLFFVGLWAVGLFLLWACFLCGFMRRGFWSFFLAPKDLQGRAGAPAPPARGGCPWYPAKKNSPYLVSRLLRPLLRAPPPILTRLPRRLRSRRPCGPFLFFAKSPPPLLLPRPPRSLKQGRNGPQGRSFAPLPGRNIARRPPLGLAPLVLEAAFRPAPASLLPLASRGGAAGRFASPKPGPPARASGLAAGASPPPAKRRPPGAAPVQSTAPRFQGILSCLCMHFSTCAIQVSV